MTMRQRRSIRLPDHDYASTGVYFVTFNTYGRQHLFGEVRDAQMILSEWGAIAYSFLRGVSDISGRIRLDASVIMPDHIHMIVWVASPEEEFGFGDYERSLLTIKRRFAAPKSKTLSSVIGSYKAGVSRYIHLDNPAFVRIWQRDYYERIIRNEIELESYRFYIQNNPKKWWEKYGPRGEL